MTFLINFRTHKGSLSAIVFSAQIFSLNGVWASNISPAEEIFENNRELLGHVLSYFSPAEILQGPAQVCKQWRQVSNDSEPLWEELSKHHRQLTLPEHLKIECKRNLPSEGKGEGIRFSAELKLGTITLRFAGFEDSASQAGVTLSLIPGQRTISDLSLTTHSPLNVSDVWRYGVLVNARCGNEVITTTRLCPTEVQAITPPILNEDFIHKNQAKLNEGQKVTYMDEQTKISWVLVKSKLLPSCNNSQTIAEDKLWAEIYGGMLNMTPILKFELTLGGLDLETYTQIDLFDLIYRGKLHNPGGQDWISSVRL